MPVSSTSSTDIEAPIGVVWEALADVGGWPRWAPRVEVRAVADVRPDAGFTWKLNGVTIRAVFIVVDPPLELSWKGRFLVYEAVDRNLLEAIGATRTRVTFEEALTGPLLPLLYRPAQLRANHERWLAALKRFVESGSAPQGRAPAER